MTENTSALPRHVAVIMDGNGRWAKERGLERTAGHREGARAVRKIVTRARELGIRYLTLYAFSSQNWKRPSQEVSELMGLLVDFCQSEKQLLLDKDIRFRIMGERSRVPMGARMAAEVLEATTQGRTSMDLVIALSYGGREELVEAARQIAHKVKAGKLREADIDERTVADHLWTAGIPDPDLVIRTSGELRVSNFLLWQIAYAELYVDNRYWPDFDEAAFDEALAAYASRTRRFGGV